MDIAQIALSAVAFIGTLMNNSIKFKWKKWGFTLWIPSNFGFMAYFFYNGDIAIGILYATYFVIAIRGAYSHWKIGDGGTK